MTEEPNIKHVTMTPIDILTVVSVHDLGPLWLKGNTRVFHASDQNWLVVSSVFIFTRILGESDPI